MIDEATGHGGRREDGPHRRTGPNAGGGLESGRQPLRMRTGITGATGLIGGALASELVSRGHRVVAFTRRAGSPPELPPSLPSQVEAVHWDPGATADRTAAEALGHLDAVVHLAGEPVGKRWNAVRRQRIRESRIEGTRGLVAALARLPQPPKRLLAASAIGYYGPRGDEELTEDAGAGRDFLAGVCRRWEAAAAAARDSGIETASLRIGVALSPEGGALAAMLPPFRLGVGGRLGSGRQWMSWIHLADLVGAICHLLDAPAGSLAPIYNLTAPAPATNADFTRALGRVLRRPAVFPAPGFVMRLAFGDMADALLLSGQRVLPAQLLDSGFRFAHPELEPALAELLGTA